MRTLAQIAWTSVLLAVLFLTASLAQAASAVIPIQSDSGSLIAHTVELPRFVFEELTGALSGFMGRAEALLPGPIGITLLIAPVLALNALAILIAVLKHRAGVSQRSNPNHSIGPIREAGLFARFHPTAGNLLLDFHSTELAS